MGYLGGALAQMQLEAAIWKCYCGQEVKDASGTGWLARMQLCMFGHLEVLEWAISQGCELDVQTCMDEAHYGGHFLEVREWLRRVNRP